ncbi:ATP-grasp domain-containing protein [Methanopyrus sp.]
MKVLFVGARLFRDVAEYAGSTGVYRILTESNPRSMDWELADEVHFVPRGMEHPMRIALERHVDGVIPLIGVDDPLPDVGKMKEELEAYGIRVVASDREGVEIGVNKVKAKIIFEELNVPTPEWEVVENERPSIDPPMVVKDPRSQAGLGVKVHKTRKPRVTGRKLVEEFIEGAEVSIEVLSWDGEVVPLVPTFKGSTTDRRHPINRMRMSPAPIDPSVERRIKKFAAKIVKRLGLEGNVDFDVVVREDEFWFLEFNPRPSGTRYMTSGCTGIWPLRELVDMGIGRWRPPKVRKLWCAIECPVWRPADKGRLREMFDGGVYHVFYEYYGRFDVGGRVTVRGDSFKEAFGRLRSTLKAAGADAKRAEREYRRRLREIEEYL